MLGKKKTYSSLPLWTVFVAVSSALNASTAAGVDEKPKPSPDRGYALAQNFCKGCHLIGDNADAAVPAGIPTFRGIANKPGQTSGHIMEILMRPHPPMPDIQLTREEMMHILAYLETLRTDKSGTPLLELDEPGSKPVYPDHS